MKRNMGNLDRGIRAVVALIFAALIVTGTVSGVLAIVLGAVAAVFLLTSLIGFCPLYAPFGISTCPREN